MTHERMPPEAELAKLADGSLPVDRQEHVRAQLQHSPELTASLAEQQHVVALLRSMDEPAPAALRARVAEMTGDARTPRRRLPRPARILALPVATALAVVIAAVVILVGGSGGGSVSGVPTVPVAARLALASATLPAPAVDPADRKQLTMTASGIAFPNWGRVIGARTDRTGGRTITTVYYAARNGVRIGYSITSGAPLTGSRGPVDSDFRIRYTLGQEGSAPLIAWVRSGHTCVIAGQGANYRTLVALATASVGS